MLWNLSYQQPSLCSFSIHVHYMEDKIIESITTVLKSSYCALSEFSLFASGKVCPDLERLLAITGYQSYLQKITTLMYKVEQLLGCMLSARYHKYTTIFPVDQISLIDLNLKKRKTTLGLSPVSARFS